MSKQEITDIEAEIDKLLESTDDEKSSTKEVVSPSLKSDDSVDKYHEVKELTKEEWDATENVEYVPEGFE